MILDKRPSNDFLIDMGAYVLVAETTRQSSITAFLSHPVTNLSSSSSNLARCKHYGYVLELADREEYHKYQGEL